MPARRRRCHVLRRVRCSGARPVFDVPIRFSRRALRSSRGCALDAFALEMDQIEREVDEPFRGERFATACCIASKLLRPSGTHHHQFAVDQPVRDAERADGFSDFRKPGCPVQSVPADQPDATVRNHAADAIAIELDLVYPLVARGRCLRERCELRIVLGGRHVGNGRQRSRNASRLRASASKSG